MGVNICICDKLSEKYVKDSSIDCYKNCESSFPNVITANNLNANSFNNNNTEEKEKYKNVFKENRQISKSSNNKPVLSTSYSNNNYVSEEKYLENIIKIQKYYRKYIETKNNKKNINIENENDKEKDKENRISLRMNLEMSETNFSTNTFRNLHAVQNQNNTSNNKYEDNASGVISPFNIKNKLKNNYKFSGYLKKSAKKYKSVISLKNNSDNSNTSEKKEINDNDNEERSEIVKQGFGKFMFNDGSEFCGIFNDNNLQVFGKYSNIDHNKEKYNGLKNDKEIIITDNLNYEEFIGKYQDYISDGFGIYRNFITNLRVTGIFKENGISGIGIENSAEGGYIYTGEFKNNKKEGIGTIEWKDGNKYQGEFKDNQLNGYGIIEYPGKKYYHGEVKNGRMDGFGEFFWKEEKRYIGNYKNDKRNGFGVFIFKSNDFKNTSLYENENNISAYIGFWKNGNMDGFGMKINNLDIKYGLWENGTKRKYLESSFALKTYIKWIDKKYNKLFLGQQTYIINFMENCLNISNDIYPFNQESQNEK